MFGCGIARLVLHHSRQTTLFDSQPNCRTSKECARQHCAKQLQGVFVFFTLRIVPFVGLGTVGVLERKWPVEVPDEAAEAMQCLSHP